MVDGVEYTLQRIKYVLNGRTLGRADLESFITTIIQRFEVGQPEFIAFKSDGEGGEEELHVYWEELDFLVMFDDWGPLEVEYEEGMEQGLVDWVMEQLELAHARRVEDGVAVELDEVECGGDDGDSEFDEQLKVEFYTWGDLYQAIEDQSESMVQCSMAMEWAEGQRGVDREPHEMGFMVASDGEGLFVGHEGAGVCVTVDGRVSEVYNKP